MYIKNITGKKDLLINILQIQIILFLVFSALSCTGSENGNFESFLSRQNKSSVLELEYAEKFSADIYDDFILLSIDSFSGSKKHRYILSEDQNYLEALKSRYKSSSLSFIKTPVNRVVSLSSQNIAFIDALSLLDSVRGIDLKRNISNTAVHEMVSEGEIYELGEGREIDLEKTGLINPDLILASGTGGEYDAGDILKGSNIVLTCEWLEKTPLARSEWIKCIALFFACTDQAGIIFNRIKDNYNNLKNEALKSEHSFSVLPNMVYGDSWAVPGGKSFAANLFKDANITYPWGDDNSEGSIFLDFESVLAKGSDADIWLINSMNINSISEIIKTDSRYNLFSAVKTFNVYNNNKNTGNYGNPYWEEGILYPDRILSDLIKIFHPEIENNNPFYFYRKLSAE